MLFVFNLQYISAQKNETTSSDSYDKMAAQMAEWMDMVWDQEPEEGTANLKFLLKKKGEPFAGKISMSGEFSFRTKGRINHSQAFNPNSNGRWVYEGITPGTYKLIIEGKERFEGFIWSKKNVEVKANSSPLYEIELEVSKEKEN